MTHPEHLLADLVSGSLGGRDREALEAHLAACERCSSQVRSAKAARTALRGLPEVQVPTAVRSNLRSVPAPSRPAPGWYRWLGAAAAAAVIALILTNLPTDTNSTQRASAGSALGGSAKAENTAALQLLVQDRDYNQAALDDLTSATVREAGLAPGAPADASSGGTVFSGGRIGTEAETQAALACIARAVPADIGAPFALLLARFDGIPSFFAFYTHHPPNTGRSASVQAWIVDRQTCTTSGLTIHKV